MAELEAELATSRFEEVGSVAPGIPTIVIIIIIISRPGAAQNRAAAPAVGHYCAACREPVPSAPDNKPPAERV